MKLRVCLPVTLLLLSSLACSGADDTGAAADTTWSVDGLAIGRDSLNYAVVSGTVTLQDDFAPAGTGAEVRFYSDEYSTLIVADSDTIGRDLEGVGTTQAFEMSHYEVYVQPATGGYDRVCAEFRADDSNYEEWTEVGCTP
jgi:hypothetical protein